MAKQKRKVTMPAGIRNKMMAAVSMLMVSSIMMVSSTYAWFTLSTAPEVKNISTTVAGNGSLEIALMPTTGLFSDIGTGFSSTANGGSVALTAANTTWGNIINLSDTSYGLNSVNLNPAFLNVRHSYSEDGKVVATSETNFADAAKPLIIAAYGEDGRPAGAMADTVIVKSYASGESGATQGVFNGNAYGVRAIGEEYIASDGTSVSNTGNIKTTYGYVIDLAFRMNAADSAVGEGASKTNGNLILQTDEAQRIYTDSTNEATKGGGSYMSFDTQGSNIDITNLMKAVRVTFVQDFGKNNATTGEGTSTSATPVILGTAKLDMSDGAVKTDGSVKKASLFLYDSNGNKVTGTDAVLLAMEKNTAKQVSAIVWLDGNDITNANVAYNVEKLAKSTLNLQFSTDVTLKPANDNVLYGTTSTSATTVELEDNGQVTEPVGEDNGDAGSES